MPTFELNPIQRFAGTSAAIRRPKVCPILPPLHASHSQLTAPQEITSFSFDETHTLRLDDSSLKWYYPPQIGADLCAGFDTFNKMDDTRDDHLGCLLTSIVALEKKTGERVEADVVTWRGMMTKVSPPRPTFEVCGREGSC
jgi:RAT1-interacting protein